MPTDSAELATILPYSRPLTFHLVPLSITYKVVTEVVLMERPRRLSAAFVQTVTTPGRFGDGRGGLGLSMLVKSTTSGRLSKSWSQRLRIEGVPRDMGIGSFPKVTLTEARKRALANARTVEEGGDPRRKAQAKPTFEEAMERTIEVLRPGWRNARTEAILRRTMTEYVLPHIGKRPIDAITPADVLSFLAPVAVAKPAVAKKAKMGLSQTFKWAIAQRAAFRQSRRPEHRGGHAQAQHERASSGLATLASRRSPPNRAGFGRLARHKAGLRVPRLDGSPVRRGPASGNGARSTYRRPPGRFRQPV